MRENEPVLLVLSVCDGEIILEKGEILYEKCHEEIMQKSFIRRYRRLVITASILTPTILLFVLIVMRVIPLPVSGKAIIFSAPFWTNKADEEPDHKKEPDDWSSHLD